MPERRPYLLDVVRVRKGQRLLLGPDDKVIHLGTEPDLNAGGEWHRFAVLVAEKGSGMPGGEHA